MKLVGYFKTNAYKPDIIVAWDKVEILQNEVVFCKIISFVFALLVFLWDHNYFMRKNVQITGQIMEG